MENLEETWHDEEPETFEKIQENVTALRVALKGKAPADADLGMAEWKVYGYTYEEPEPEPAKEFEYASDLAWESAHSDYGQVKKDGAVYGGKLILNTEDGSKIFDKGIGADTNSEVVYNIEGKDYYKFESYIGINKNAGKQGGEAIFKVYVDDELKYISPVKMRDDNCEFISVEIPENAKKVKLEAVWSGNTENPEARYNTHVNWADAKFFITHEQEETVDKTVLQELINYAKSQQEKEEYKYVVPIVKEKFEKALKEAVAINEKTDATQEEVDAAYDELLKMVHMLDFTGNSESLKVLVDVAKGLNEKLYTEDSWNVLKDALAKAKEVLADENALQEEIDATKDALQKAMDSLVKITVDKSKLQKLVNDSKKYEDKLDEYTKATAEIFTGALQNARDILAKEDATEEEVDAAYAALQNSIFGLRLIPNKDKLDELIKEAEKTDFAMYTAESGDAVKVALSQAKAVFADENATKEDVKKAEKELKAAMDGLKLVSNDGNNAGTDNKGGKTSNDTNKKSAKTGDDGNATIPVTTGLLALLGILFSRKKK